MNQLSRSETNDAAWMSYANCRDQDTYIFFPDADDPDMIKKAKKICMMCVVTDECLEYAFSHREIAGVWGGMTEKERSRQYVRRENDIGHNNQSVNLSIRKEGPELIG